MAEIAASELLSKIIIHFNHCHLLTLGPIHYSLSGLKFGNHFCHFFVWQNVWVCHPNLANLFGALPRVCTKHSFCLSSAKILILLISSHCKNVHITDTTILACLSVAKQYKHARSYCWQWTHFTMGTQWAKSTFLRSWDKKICLHIYVVVLLTCLPSLDGKRERFVTKKVAKSDCQTRVRTGTIVKTCNIIHWYKLGLRKEWICNERPITICPIVYMLASCQD